MKMMTTKRVCSFCGKPAKAIVSNKEHDKSICFKCVYHARVEMGELAPGVISCLKCSSMSGFTLTTQAGRSINYAPKSAGLIRYEPDDVGLGKNDSIKKATCRACNASLPLWLLDFTIHE